MRHEFPKSRRLLTSAEFDRVFDGRNSRSDGRIVMYALPNGQESPRLGLVVSKKCGNAVRRNWWKRRLREAFRMVQHDLPPGLDLVVIPRSNAVADVSQLTASMLNLAAPLAVKLAAGRPLER